MFLDRPILRNFLCGLMILAIFLVGAGFAFAQQLDKVDDFPKRPITLVIPYSYGGGFDTWSRTAAVPILKELTGVPIQAINVAGGQTSRAMLFAQQQPADGYTICGLESAAALGAKRIPYSLEEDFIQLGICVIMPLRFYVRPASPFEDFDDLVKYAREHPEGKIKVASGDSRLGTLGLPIFHVFDQAGILDNLNFISYEEAEPQMKADLTTGVIDVAFGVPGPWDSFVKAGQIRVLAKLENIKEKYGIKTTFLFRGFMIKKGVPAEKISYLEKLVKVMATSEEYKQKVRRLGSLPTYISPEEATKTVKDMGEAFMAVVKRMGWKIE